MPRPIDCVTAAPRAPRATHPIGSGIAPFSALKPGDRFRLGREDGVVWEKTDERSAIVYHDSSCSLIVRAEVYVFPTTATEGAPTREERRAALMADVERRIARADARGATREEAPF